MVASTGAPSAFLATARVAATLLRHPAVAAQWDAESALPRFSVRGVAGHLAHQLPTAPGRPVRLPFWGPWSLTLEDLLITRTMELAVHADDLAVSVGIDTPVLPGAAADLVVTLLARVAVGRHGPTPVIRALSRAERAPDTIAAF